MTFRQWTEFMILTLIWGSSFLWIKLAVRETGPYTVVTLRILFALAALVPVLFIRHPGFPRGVRMWGVIAVQGILSAALPWVLITWAEQHIDSAVAVVLNGTVPLFTIVAAHLWLSDDKMTRSRVTGLLVGFLGVVLLVQRDLRMLGVENARMALLGQAAMLGASVAYAGSNVWARAKLRGVPPIFQAFYTLLVADVIMWSITPSVEAPFTLPGHGLTWFAIGWLGVLGAAVGYLVFYRLLHDIGPTRVAMVTYTIPVVGVTLGVVFLDEQLTWGLVAGTILIVSGVWGATRR